MANTGANLPFDPSVQGVRQYWSGLNRPVQIGVVVAVVALILFLILMIYYFTQPRKEVLFSDMDTLQAQEVTQRLEELGVSYQLDEGGTMIKVPSEERDRMRLELSPDMHARGMGFELFEESGLLESEFERSKRYQSALQEELRRTIVHLDNVDAARVHVALPESRGFPAERGDPSASVQLNLPAMTTMEDKQVEGIVHLVAGSVEDLEPENVTIIDSEGNPLYDSLLDDMEREQGMTTVEDQTRHRREFERELETRLQEMLDRIYGDGRADVMVSAELDFDRRETESIEYGENVPRSEQIIEEEYDGEGLPEDMGEVGEENIPGYQAPMFAGDYEYQYLETITNYEVDEVRELVSTAPGAVDRLSAAVAIDDDNVEAADEQEINELVTSALGFDPARGDTVNVQQIPFEEEIAPDPILSEVLLPDLIRYGVIALIALFFFILALVFVLRKTRAPQVQEGMEPVTPEGFSLEGVMEEQEREKTEEEEMTEKVKKMAEEQPENVAYLLKTWLIEE